MPYTERQQEEFLELFYQDFPDEYDEVWYEGVSSTQMMKELKSKYPDYYNKCMQVYGYQNPGTRVTRRRYIFSE